MPDIKPCLWFAPRPRKPPTLRLGLPQLQDQQRDARRAREPGDRRRLVLDG